ncbi:hypothetical protein PWT90_07705 [Aphanocladium album]|nr:hypothetical protein PWT90_07705 [Aphanocladium album]
MNLRHQELFDTLAELYTLQAVLGNLPADDVVIPHGVTFNRAAALEAGYAEEAVRVMAYMPYLAENSAGFELFPSTYVERYVDAPDHDVVSYKCSRELDTLAGEDVYFPPSFLRITNQNVYGHTFLYDTDTGLVREWRPFYDDIDIDNQDWDSLPTKSPAETFGPWIRNFRELTMFRIGPHKVAWSPDAPSSRVDAQVILDAEENVRLAELKVRDLYLENGWDVDAKEQSGFDLENFVAQRTAHDEQVIRPLEDKVDEAYKLARK